MQRVSNGLRWLRDLRYGQDTDARTQRLLGFVGIGLVMVIVVASALIYLVPFGKSSYSAFLTDAGTVKAGDDVRIAGISVGSVESLELTDDAVRMTITVEDDVFLGDHTTLDIRMLTPIGGHYVAVKPAGTEPLGTNTIAADRVTLPYNLTEAIQDSHAPIAGVEGATVRESLASLSASLSTAPGSVQSFTDAVSTLVGLLNTQNDDVSRALNVAQEYVSMLSDSRSIIGSMLTKIGLMETQILTRKADVTEALRVVSEILERIAAIEPAWREQLEPMADRLLAAKPGLDELGQRLGAVAELLAQAGERFLRVITPQGVAVDQSDLVLPRPVCVPMPGRGC